MGEKVVAWSHELNLYTLTVTRTAFLGNSNVNLLRAASSSFESKERLACSIWGEGWSKSWRTHWYRSTVDCSGVGALGDEYSLHTPLATLKTMHVNFFFLWDTYRFCLFSEHICILFQKVCIWLNCHVVVWFTDKSFNRFVVTLYDVFW
jgi:hypothetical protein